MRKFYFLILFLFITSTAVTSQKFIWKTGVNSFFDNTEFAHSNVQKPQTMAGVHVTPEFGVSWNENHRILVGVDAMHEFGSDKIIDFINPVAYYEFDGKPFRFYMGAFPRNLALDRYPRMFFQDSIANYRPVLNGLFWEFYSKSSYINVWLDWTGRQALNQRETFFMGWSGQYNYSVLYFRHFGYMFHFAKSKEPVIPESLHDNGLVLTSIGIDFASKTPFEKLEANIGWSVGLERDRDLNNKWITPQGLLSEIKIEYKGLGLFNTFYAGAEQQVFYSEHGNSLYWGDSFYRLENYNRTDLYINFFKTNVVNVKFIFSLHFAEQTMYNQQALYASFNLDNLQKKEKAKYEYIWSNWFRNK